MEEYTYWNEYVELAIEKRKGQIRHQLTSEHFKGISVSKNKRRAYRQTPEFLEKLEAAISKDANIKLLRDSKPGDARLTAEYLKYRKNAEKKRKEKFVKDEICKLKEHLTELSNTPFFDEINAEIMDRLKDDIRENLSTEKLDIREEWFYSWEYRKGIFE